MDGLGVHQVAPHNRAGALVSLCPTVRSCGVPIVQYCRTSSVQFASDHANTVEKSGKSGCFRGVRVDHDMSTTCPPPPHVTLYQNAWCRPHRPLCLPVLIFLAVEHIDFNDSHFLPPKAAIVSSGQAQRRVRRQKRRAVSNSESSATERRCDSQLGCLDGSTHCLT